MWLFIGAALAVLTTGISIFGVSIYLLLSNLGSSIAEVANDAILAETGKPSVSSSKSSKPSSSGELQSPQSMFLFFGILASLQFVITITVRESSLRLPKSPGNVGIKTKLAELGSALKKPDIAYSLSWFAASYAMIPALAGTVFFYQTVYLKIDSWVLGLSKVFGQAAMLLWSVVYNQHLKSIPSRKLISSVRVSMAVLMLSDMLFVRGFYGKMYVPDSV